MRGLVGHGNARQSEYEHFLVAHIDRAQIGQMGEDRKHELGQAGIGVVG